MEHRLIFRYPSPEQGNLEKAFFHFDVEQSAQNSRRKKMKNLEERVSSLAEREQDLNDEIVQLEKRIDQDDDDSRDWKEYMDIHYQIESRDANLRSIRMRRMKIRRWLDDTLVREDRLDWSLTHRKQA